MPIILKFYCQQNVEYFYVYKIGTGKVIVLENLVLLVFYSLLGLAPFTLIFGKSYRTKSHSLFGSLLAAWFDDWHVEVRTAEVPNLTLPSTKCQYRLKQTELSRSDSQRHKYELPTAQVLAFVYTPNRKYPDTHNMWMRTKLYSLVHRENRIITEIINWRCRLGSFDDSVTRDGDPTN